MTEETDMPRALDPALQEEPRTDPYTKDSDDFEEGKIDFFETTPEQRQESFKTMFSNKVEPLSHIAPPDECEMYSRYEDEIIAAYLRYTTFTVKVWVNYDAATKKFYIDPRANDCGKVILTPRERANLEAICADSELGRVRLEIGTPFTNLCYVTVRSVPSKLDVGFDIGVKMIAVDNQHPEVTDFIYNSFVDFHRGELPYGRKGFRVRTSSPLRQTAVGNLRMRSTFTNNGS